MDRVNPQEIRSKFEWLAGIWDGEGTFTISRQSGKRGKTFYSPQATLTNTCPLMILEISKILDQESISFHLFEEERRSGKHKDCFHVTIHHHEMLEKFIQLLLPSLVSKKAQAQILLRFLDRRKAYKRTPIQDTDTGRIIGMKSLGYSNEEKELIADIRKLNATGKQYEDPQRLHAKHEIDLMKI